MEVYFSPEFIKQDSQVLNVVDANGNAVGYMAFIFDEKKMYVYGLLENEGMREDFKDLVTPFIQGMSKMKPNLEVYCYLSVGGKRLDVGQQQGQSNPSNG